MGASPMLSRKKEMQAEVLPAEVLQDAVGERNETGSKEGPDLSFVSLPVTVRERLERVSDGVFHNLDRDEERCQQMERKRAILSGTLWVMGHAREDAIEARARGMTKPGNDLLVGRLMQVDIADGGTWERDGWDYVLLKVRAESGGRVWRSPDVPDWLNERTLQPPGTWQGMSGSGVWWAGSEEGSGKPWLSLCGTVFYEDESGGLLRAHGAGSIRRVMETVREGDNRGRP